jgi:hypothetical protein
VLRGDHDFKRTAAESTAFGMLRVHRLSGFSLMRGEYVECRVWALILREIVAERSTCAQLEVAQEPGVSGKLVTQPQ